MGRTHHVKADKYQAARLVLSMLRALAIRVRMPNRVARGLTRAPLHSVCGSAQGISLGW